MYAKLNLSKVFLFLPILITTIILFLCFQKNFLFIHTLIELFAVVIAFTIFSIGWNTKSYTNNNFFIILSVGYLFVGIFTIFHIITYSGMNIIENLSANEPTQFWITTRLINSISFLTAIIFMDNRKALNGKIILIFGMIISVVLISAIFLGLFPDCFIDGYGLTRFKKGAEYFICILALLSGVLLVRRRILLGSDSYILLLLFILLSILSELSFTLYVDVYGLSNLIGHMFMIFSSIIIYYTLISGSLKGPYKFLFNNVSDYINELSEKNRVLRVMGAAVSSCLNGIVLIDLDGNITYVNSACLEVFGYENEEMVGFNVKHFDESNKTIQEIKEGLNKDGRWQGELSVKKKDGIPLILFISVNYAYTEDNLPICLMASLQDITQRNKVERELLKAKRDAEAASIAKSNFLANMSHEIRTPMNGILGYLKLLEYENKDDVLKEYIRNIEISTDTLLTIVNDILDVSKIEAGKLILENIPYDLHETIKNAIVPFNTKANEKDVDLRVNIEKEVPRMVMGDPTRLRQVICNLISNAIKFTKCGHVSIHVKQLKDNLIKFSVIDTGIGMEKAVLDKIFEPFIQAEVSSTRNFGGTGLGLSICKSIVDMMNGEIFVESTLGEGSNFTFILPLEEVFCDKISEYNKTENRYYTLKDYNNLSILLVEDNEVNRTLFTLLLNVHNLKCDVAFDGADAVKKATIKEYDLIFMDCQMPVMDGFDATKKIREIEGINRHSIIIAMTAYAMKGDAEKCFEAGMDDYLSKPIYLEDVGAILEKYVIN